MRLAYLRPVCACCTQHAKMLLRVVVESREEFDESLANERRPAIL